MSVRLLQSIAVSQGVDITAVGAVVWEFVNWLSYKPTCFKSFQTYYFWKKNFHKMSNMLQSCHIEVGVNCIHKSESLMKRQVFLMTTLMNHRCYQCILDWGMIFLRSCWKLQKSLSRGSLADLIGWILPGFVMFDIQQRNQKRYKQKN